MTTPAELILGMAKRATTPAECGAVGRAISRYAHAAGACDLDLIEEAQSIAREKLDGYLSNKILPMRNNS